MLKEKQGPIMLEDNGSRHGTFVNGVRLDPFQPEAICNNDIIQLGTTVDLGESIHQCLYMRFSIDLPKTHVIPSEDNPIRGGTYACPDDYSDDDSSCSDVLDDEDVSDSSVELERELEKLEAEGTTPDDEEVSLCESEGEDSGAEEEFLERIQQAASRTGRISSPTSPAQHYFNFLQRMVMLLLLLAGQRRYANFVLGLKGKKRQSHGASNRQ